MEQLKTCSLHLLYLLTWCCLTIQAAMDLPKFRQMVLLYPGYYLHAGRYRDRDVINMIGGQTTSSAHLHNTASLRLSWMLNRLGGQHALGKTPVNLSKHGNDSFTGKDGNQYIYRNTAYGPFLAARYGSPLVNRVPMPLAEYSPYRIMSAFHRKQGIVRLVSYHGSHAGGHIGLWDCDHFVHSRDWSQDMYILSAELWEAPDSYCPPADRSTPSPRLVQVSISPQQLANALLQSRQMEEENNSRHHHRRRHHYRHLHSRQKTSPGLQ